MWRYEINQISQERRTATVGVRLGIRLLVVILACGLSNAIVAASAKSGGSLSRVEFSRHRPFHFYESIVAREPSTCAQLFSELSKPFDPERAPPTSWQPRTDQTAILGNRFLVGPWLIREFETGNTKESDRPTSYYWEQLIVDVDNDGHKDAVYRSFNTIDDEQDENLTISTTPKADEFAGGILPAQRVREIVGNSKVGESLRSNVVLISGKTVTPNRIDDGEFYQTFFDIVSVNGRSYLLVAPAHYWNRRFDVLVLSLHSPRRMSLICQFRSRWTVSD